MKNYSTVTLGWNREGISKQLIKEFMSKLNLFNFKAPIGKTTIILYLPFFWSWIFFKLLQNKPKIIHACDLDTVIPCYIYKVLFRKRLVFDVCDSYAMSKISPKNKLLYSFVDSLEKKLVTKADVFVTVSEKLLTTFQKRPKRCNVIMNCPTKFEGSNIKSLNKNLKLVYTGNIIHSRGLGRIAEAIKNLPGVDFNFAGRIIDEKLHNEILKMPKANYYGVLKLSDALSLEANSDVMIILYDLKIPINNFAMPNKIFEAMMFGLPVITNIAPEIVDKAECGIKVQYNDIDQIKSAITQLRDNTDLRKRLGTNGRKAFAEIYNWEIMEQKLYKTYEPLLK